MKDENSIRNSLDLIYPIFDQRINYLNLFAEALDEANAWQNDKRMGFSNWVVVSPKINKIRLIAGHHIVTTLNPGSIWMAFDEEQLQEERSLYHSISGKIEWGKQNTLEGNYKLIGSRNGYLNTDSLDKTEMTLLMNAHRSSIEKAIKKDVLRQGSIRNHEPSILDAIERIIGRSNLPRPILK